MHPCPSIEDTTLGYLIKLAKVGWKVTFSRDMCMQGTGVSIVRIGHEKDDVRSKDGRKI